MCRAIEDMWKIGFKGGWQESKREIARRMLAAGKYALSEIADITEFSIEEEKKYKLKRAFNIKFDVHIYVG